MIEIKTRADLLAQFEALPDGAIVPEAMAAAVRDRKPSSLQRERHMGTGPAYVKDGAKVGYVKRALVEHQRRCTITPALSASNSEAA